MRTYLAQDLDPNDVDLDDDEDEDDDGATALVEAVNMARSGARTRVLVSEGVDPRLVETLRDQQPRLVAGGGTGGGGGGVYSTLTLPG